MNLSPTPPPPSCLQVAFPPSKLPAQICSNTPYPFGEGRRGRQHPLPLQVAFGVRGGNLEEGKGWGGGGKGNTPYPSKLLHIWAGNLEGRRQLGGGVRVRGCVC